MCFEARNNIWNPQGIFPMLKLLQITVVPWDAPLYHQQETATGIPDTDAVHKTSPWALPWLSSSGSVLWVSQLTLDTSIGSWWSSAIFAIRSSVAQHLPPFNSSPPEQNGRHYGRRHSNFTEICSQESNRQQGGIGWGNGLTPSRQQAITSTNDDPVHWRIYAALGGRISMLVYCTVYVWELISNFTLHFIMDSIVSIHLPSQTMWSSTTQPSAIL